MIILKNKELGDNQERERNQAKLEQLLANKNNIQAQIDENDRLREEAYQEYLKEKA